MVVVWRLIEIVGRDEGRQETLCDGMGISEWPRRSFSHEICVKSWWGVHWKQVSGKWNLLGGEVEPTRWLSGTYLVTKWDLLGGEVGPIRRLSGTYLVVKWNLPGGEVEPTR